MSLSAKAASAAATLVWYEQAVMKLNPGLIALAIGAFGIGVTEFAPMGLLPVIAQDLHVSIPAAGLVVSEVPPGAAPTRWRFLSRNRVIATRIWCTASASPAHAFV